MLFAVNEYGGCLKYASDRLKKNKEIVAAAISLNGSALEYADD